MFSHCYPCSCAGSPFTADMSGRARVHSLGGGMIRTPLGQPAVVAIDPRKAGHLAESALVEVIGELDTNNLLLRS